MDRHAERSIGSMNGKGHICLQGKILGRVYYSLQVNRMFYLGDGPKGPVEIPEDWVMRGQVSISDTPETKKEMVRAMGDGGEFTLVLKDGHECEGVMLKVDLRYLDTFSLVCWSAYGPVPG